MARRIIISVKNSQLVLIVLVIAVIIGAVWFWFFKTESSKIQTQEAPSLGSEIFEKTQNPLGGKLPDTNPFDDQPNPFGDKTNPIEKAYTNPF